jgi:ganglioside GM2 activator
VVLRKKVLGAWVKLPCISNVGSCSYDNFCDLLGKGDCGPVLDEYHVPCHCPFATGKYAIPPTSVAIPQPKSVPSWLESGDYSAQGTLYDANGKRLACYYVEVSLKA